MTRPDRRAGGEDPTRALIEELLRTGLTLVDVLSFLIEDLPDEAFPGEDNAAVVLEMLVGSCRPVIDAAGESDRRATTALVGEIREKALDDLRLAAKLASATE
jgi:hypothetical protein